MANRVPKNIINSMQKIANLSQATIKHINKVEEWLSSKGIDSNALRNGDMTVIKEEIMLERNGIIHDACVIYSGENEIAEFVGVYA